MTSAFIISYIPFHIRFFQCIRKYLETGQSFPHLANAFKYFLSILTIFFAFLVQGQQYLKYGIVVVATLYSYCWDIYMDWGLLRDRRWLRPKILFPENWYYFSAFSNLVLRFLWVLTLFPESFFS